MRENIVIAEDARLIFTDVPAKVCAAYRVTDGGFGGGDPLGSFAWWPAGSGGTLRT